MGSGACAGQEEACAGQGGVALDKGVNHPYVAPELNSTAGP